MLKKQTIDLIKINEAEFKDIFSICIGKGYLYQRRFIEYLGKYTYWDSNVEEGTLKLDDRLFDVEYIGTTSESDDYWYSAEVESIIPARYVNIMRNSRKAIQALKIKELGNDEILLRNDINGYNLSMIYSAFASENVTYFCVTGQASIHMFVKNLPEEIFRKMNPAEFSSIIMELTNFNVNRKLMVKALLNENDIEYYEDKNNIVAKFSEKSILTVEFNDNGTKVSGRL